jgi:hypothetical protein
MGQRDIMKIHDSQFGDEERYVAFDLANDFAPDFAMRVHHDKVLDAEGNQVGVSSGRMYSAYCLRSVPSTFLFRG